MYPLLGGQTDFDRALLWQILEILNEWEPYHRRWCRRAEHFWALYRNYQDFKTSLTESTTARGRDAVLSDGQGEFGRELFVPLSFSTVETIVPAMLQNPPVLTVLPRNRTSEVNVHNVKGILESQSENIDLHLRLQTMGKDGLITGLGVGKGWWHKEYVQRSAPQSFAMPPGMAPRQVMQLVFDDPDWRAIDPCDWIKDPFAESVDLMDGAFHRTWRSTRYVKKMRDSRQWRNLDQVTDLDGLAEGRRYDEVQGARRVADDMIVGGTSEPTTVAQGRKTAIHEVLEFHDGEKIVTILDRKVVVAAGQNPDWQGRMPFQAYRPTEKPHKIDGIGEIEPIEQLQEEVNTMRTQRRYNADLVLQRVFAFRDGMVEREDIGFGPGWAIPVNGDPRELLMPLQPGDIPHSSYEEEDRMMGDVDRTSGISDVIAGAGMQGGGDTATGVQLVQSAASRRIENKTMRLEFEAIVPIARLFLGMDQVRIMLNREVRIPAQPTPGQPERRWAWIDVGPGELAGEFELKAGGTAPENVPQNRADAQMLMTLFGQVPGIDPRVLSSRALELMGEDQPQTFLAPPQPQVPAEVLDRLVEAGVPPQIVAGALAQVGGPNLLGGAAPPPGQPPELNAGVDEAGSPSEAPPESQGVPAPPPPAPEPAGAAA